MKTVAPAATATTTRNSQCSFTTQPKSSGRGMPGRPNGPPVRPTQLFITLKTIIWNAKVAITK